MAPHCPQSVFFGAGAGDDPHPHTPSPSDCGVTALARIAARRGAYAPSVPRRCSTTLPTATAARRSFRATLEDRRIPSTCPVLHEQGRFRFTKSLPFRVILTDGGKGAGARIRSGRLFHRP